MTARYIAIPVPLLAIGQPLPVDLWTPSGQLLLRKGQDVQSEQHRQRLAEHQASCTTADAQAWQRAYERAVHDLLSQGGDLDAVARASLPSDIRESDYVVGQQLHGGWLDLQEVLRGILYQGGFALNPLQRLAGIASKAQELLAQDTDDSLYSLFQALAQPELGYCATHALLCAVVGELTAQKLQIPTHQRAALFQATLVMNIGMAREQDVLTRQATAPTAWQRKLIDEHPQRSITILQELGLDDPALHDIVRWHHDPHAADAAAPLLLARRILHLADAFVAKLAPRRTRAALSSFKAVKSMVVGAPEGDLGLGSAMAQAVSFYPPGTYVRLANGETAVSVQRGERANTPWVISVLDKDGVAISHLVCKPTTTPECTIQAAATLNAVKVAVPVEKVRKARQRIARPNP